MKNHFTLFLICIPLTLANDAAIEEFTAGNNLFTASVYKEIRKGQKGNFLVSPFSAEAALALTQSGAKDETANEIRSSLHLPDSQEKIESAMKSIQPSLRNNALYTVQSANKIYLKNDFEIKDQFKKVATEVFDSDLENISFEKREEAAKTMNQWVEKRTENKIKNLVSPDHLNDRTRAILINALYFRGNWSSPFEKYLTSKRDFYRNGKDAAPVDTMADTALRNYYESPELKAKFLELSFEGGDVSMTVVLPDEKEGLTTLESQIEKVIETPKYSRQSVQVSLPKFKIESQLDFKAILKQLGVKKVFNGDEADLSGIAGEKGDLIIDKVIQKTFVDVDENGVEAAAATFAGVGVPLSGFFPSKPPKEFKADHPFIFYIKLKDLVLFAGRVVDPTS